VAGAGLSERVLEVDAEVGLGVVGHDAFGHDAVGAEPRVGACPELGAGESFLVGEDFEIREAAVVVDRGVDVRVTDPATAHSFGSTMSSPSATTWDPTEFLDVDVDQRAGMVVFIAADHSPGLSVESVEPVQATTDQHAMHRGAGLVEMSRDPVGSPPPRPSQLHDPSLHPW